MSSHRRRVKHFSRDFNARKALIAGGVVSLIEVGRIKTTLERAKEIRRQAEKLVTLGKKGNVNSLRLISARLMGNVDQSKKIINEIAPKFKNRNGGYTRIIKMGIRVGDKAPMALLEFVE